MRREWIALAVVVAAVVGIALVDVAAPEFQLPRLVYAPVVLAAAYLLRPAWVMAVTLLALAFSSADGIVHRVAPVYLLIYGLSFLLVALLGAGLAQRSRRAAQLRLRTEQLAATSERDRRTLRTVLDALPAGVIVCDEHGAFRLVNPAADLLLGGRVTGDARGPSSAYTLTTADGAPFPPDELPLPRALTGQTSAGVELRVRPDGGEERVLLTAASPVRGAGGAVEGAVGVLQDVTDRVKAEAALRASEEALRASEERFRKVFEEGPMGMAFIGPDGRFVQVNAEFGRIVGRAPGALVGRGVAEITYPPDRGADAALTGRLLRGELEGFQREKRYVRPDGELVWASLRASAVHDEAGRVRYGLAMVEDIGPRRRAEQFREEYVSLISHDLRAPLGSIALRAETLERRLAAQQQVDDAKAAGAIVRGAARLNAMIQELADSARLEADQMPLERRPSELMPLVEQMLERVGSDDDRARIRLHCDADLPPVYADPARVERVLTNLVTNALKYSPGGCPIDVRLERSGHDVLVSVVDRGPGIAAADVGRVFERFYRARKGAPSEGLGLGLYISRLIVEAHGGRIWVETEEGAGSAFRFTLPAIADYQPAAPDERRPPGP